MSRRRKGRAVDGVLLLDKPEGWSSNQALQKVRWLFQARKAGHTGTLDPFATGMLPICLGEASKTAALLIDSDKIYRATAKLGEATQTGDLEGEVIQTAEVPDLAVGELEQVLQSFLGQIEQVPPMYSAIKHEGRPLYEYARQGITIERKSRRVKINSIRLLKWELPLLEFEVHCSKGTYIRTLAEDIARKLGSCAHLVALRREWVEPFEPAAMVSLQAVEQAVEAGGADNLLLPPDAGLTSWPVVVVTPDQQIPFANGNPVEADSGVIGWVRVHSENDEPLGLAEAENGRLQPRRVFVRELSES